ncbi:MAG: GyrI-like domain-containing protein [Ignavibacteria bacterium]|nr:GyrI-like domain-containing protein [Ignavibacteria bacterium]
MEAAYKERKGFKVAGLKYVGKNPQPDIANLWDKFVPRMNEPQNRINENESYGVCYDMDAEGNIYYIAGVAVSDFDNLPEGFDIVEIPDNKYAVFTHKGSIANFSQTVAYVYGEWVKNPANKKKFDAPDFEVYDERFKGDADDSECDLYVAVKND